MYRIKDEMIVESEIGENEIIILSLETGEYLGLEGIAVDIWNKIKYGNSLNDITKQLLLEYDVDKSVLQDDIKDFISELRKSCIVEEISCE